MLLQCSVGVLVCWGIGVLVCWCVAVLQCCSVVYVVHVFVVVVVLTSTRIIKSVVTGQASLANTVD